jgi:hypothetical protein
MLTVQLLEENLDKTVLHGTFGITQQAFFNAPTA